METTVWITVALLVIVTYLLFSGRGGKRPPGPLGLPFVGYLPFMTMKPYLKLQQLRQRYGPVFSLYLGNIYVVVLNDFASMKKAFAMDAFMGRPPESPFQLSKESLESGAFNGMPWKEQRRVCLHLLRDVGFGKTKTEELVKEEIMDLMGIFEELDGKPTKAAKLLSPSMSNNISSLVFGRRMRFDDPKRRMLDEVFENIGRASGQVSWQLFFPTLGKILRFFHLGGGMELDKYSAILQNFIRGEITEHEKSLDHNNIKDFIDGYLLEIEKRPSDPAFKKPVLVDLVGAFFGAGSDTVRISVEWLLLTMAAYKDVQRKVQKEIDDVIGRERFPNSADRVKMPFTEAAIFEMMRWITIVPINLFRYTLVDTELNGFTIPKHSTVVANIWGVHHDPELWGSDTEVYKPERFLTDDGKAVKKIEHFIPFSIGKRSCPGESLARMEVFVYFAAILQRFDVSLPDGQLPDFEGILGVGLTPKRQPLCIVKRQ